MLVTKYSLALALATVVPQVAATCLNDETFIYVDGEKTRTCKNIGFVEEARLRLCTIQEVADACPFSCGSCCEDNPDFKWEKNNPELNAATCKWVAKKQTRIDRYCDKTKTILTDPNPYNSDTITIRYGCPVTCDYCNDAVPIGTTPAPTSAPTKAPTAAPVTPGPTPTQPFPAPSRPPSPMPSPFPTLRPTSSPSDAPSMVPSDVPSDSPSMVPSDEPSMLPSLTPSDSPSMVPSDVPSDSPSMVPSDEPSMVPSMEPSDQPSQLPSKEPSRSPSSVPSDQPSLVPSKEPSRSPSGNPTSSIKPSPTPTASPFGPTPAPTRAPTPAPTNAPVTCDDIDGYLFPLVNNPDNDVACEFVCKNVPNYQYRQDTYCTQAAIADNCCYSCSLGPGCSAP